MSLMRLLSAGKTLVSGGEPMGRYRINTHYRLPKFGSPKNPFLKPAEAKPAAQAEMQMPAPIQKEAEQVRLSSAELAAAELKETQLVPVVAAIPVIAPAQEKVHPVLAMLDWMDDTAVQMKERIAKLELSKLIPKRKTAAAMPVVQKAADAPIQPELSLEKVRVVRNDLSDADLEIVPVKVQTKVARIKAPKVEVNRMETARELVGASE